MSRGAIYLQVKLSVPVFAKAGKQSGRSSGRPLCVLYVTGAEWVVFSENAIFLPSGERTRGLNSNSTVFRATYALNLTTSGAADTVAANCVAQGFCPGGTQNRDFDCRGLLVNIDNPIIPVRTTGCERQSSPEMARAGDFDESVMN